MKTAIARKRIDEQEVRKIRKSEGQFFFTSKHLTFLSACTAVALTGADVGVSYPLSNAAYRSFSCPVDRVHDATIAALKKMGIIMIDNDTSSESGVTITAETRELDIIINIEKVTSKTTQVKVDARKNFFLKDKATAAEIINQVGKILGE